MTHTLRTAALALALLHLPAWAQTTVTDAWVRGTVRVSLKSTPWTPA